MFVAIYRWRLKAGREQEFAQAWERVTRLIVRECGSGGSALFRADDGTYAALARWPDRESRERCAARYDEDLARMTDCIAERYPEQRLESVTDLWTTP